MYITSILINIIRFLIGAYPRWIGCEPSDKQRIYFANHTSHMDSLVIVGSFPKEIRKKIKVIAAKDYWGSSALKRYIAINELNAILLDRECKTRDPLLDIKIALKEGYSIVIYPEGTRSNEKLPNAFKGGLYNLATEFSNVELIPVYLENLNRSLPKGRYIPIPIMASVRFVKPLERIEYEAKNVFLTNCRKSPPYFVA